MTNSMKAFANDLSAHRRLQSAAKVLARGKGRLLVRLNLVREILRPLEQRDFPDHLREKFGVWERFCDEELPTRKRPTVDQATAVVIDLFEAICTARGKHGVGE